MQPEMIYPPKNIPSPILFKCSLIIRTSTSREQLAEKASTETLEATTLRLRQGLIWGRMQ